MRYIIMCGGRYEKWKTPRQLTLYEGEPIVQRTIRLLREQGVSDIAISSDNPVFEQFGVPVLKHNNGFTVHHDHSCEGSWYDAFYPTDEPVCYLFGDVIFSPEAIRTIVSTETDDIEFFASAPPFAPEYPKEWAEPFALKVSDTERLKEAIRRTKRLKAQKRFWREPIMWELWQVLTGSRLNHIDYGSYTVINDYTCDIDDPEEEQ